MGELASESMESPVAEEGAHGRGSRPTGTVTLPAGWPVPEAGQDRWIESPFADGSGGELAADGSAAESVESVEAEEQRARTASAGVAPFPHPYPLPLGMVGAVNRGLTERAAPIERDREVSGLCGAVVDLTGDPDFPPFYAHRPHEMLYLGSLPKIYAMYAAFELRRRVEIHARAMIKSLSTTVPGWQGRIFADLRRAWAPTLNAAFPHLPRGFPALATIFVIATDGATTFRQSNPYLTDEKLDEPGPDEHGRIVPPDKKVPQGEFLDWMRLMVRWSNNTAASWCIQPLSYPYINGALAAAGFFDKRSSTGLWLSGDYAGHDWLRDDRAGQRLHPRWAEAQRHPKDRRKRAVSNFTGTAWQVARFLTLLAKKKLVDEKSSDKMLAILSAGAVPGSPPAPPATPHASTPDVIIGIGSYVGEGLPPRPFTSVNSKIGLGVDGFSHDCAIVRAPSGAGSTTTLRYVSVVLGSPPGHGRAHLHKLARAFHDCIVARPSDGAGSESDQPATDFEQGFQQEFEGGDVSISALEELEEPELWASPIMSQDDDVFEDSELELPVAETEEGLELLDEQPAEEQFDASAVPPSVAAALGRKDWPLALSLAIGAGLRDANELTNLVFFAEHPELPHQPLDKNGPNFGRLSGQWATLLRAVVLPAIRKASQNTELVVSGSYVSERDLLFVGELGKRFRALVGSVAAEAGINPGLLAAVLLAEWDRRSLYLSPHEVLSFDTGVDDFFAQRKSIAEKVPAFAKVRFDEKRTTININENGRPVVTVPFRTGRDAALATAVYLKYAETKLRSGAAKNGGDFDSLPIETRFALTRIAMAAGHGQIAPDGELLWLRKQGKKWVRVKKGEHGAVLSGVASRLAKVLKGEDILVRVDEPRRYPKTAHITNRNATILVGQALHLSDWFFAAPPGGAQPEHGGPENEESPFRRGRPATSRARIAPEWEQVGAHDDHRLVTDTLDTPHRWICSVEVTIDSGPKPTPYRAPGSSSVRGWS